MSLSFGALSALAVLSLSSTAISISAAPLSFLTLGDWGSTTSDQSAIAASIATAASQVNATFLLSLGDNFYEDGVVDDQDPQWQSTYTSVYTAPSLQIPWYAIAGNHDHHKGRGQGEIDYYLNKRDSRWYFPSFYYSQTISLPSSTATLQLVFIDTVLLADASTNQDQLTWINSTLSTSTADWLMVVGHFPVYSGGEHGSTDELQSDVQPLLEQFGVDNYIAGHDHTLQHLQQNKVNYYVSGAGSKQGTYTAIDQNIFGIVTNGFMVHTIDGDQMVVSIRDETGKEIYNYQQTRIAKKKTGSKVEVKVVQM